MSDRWGGARVTHYHTLLMTAVTYALAVICLYAKNAKRNRLEYFPGFFLCFLLLFYGTGVGNGSTFRQVRGPTTSDEARGLHIYVILLPEE